MAYLEEMDLAKEEDLGQKPLRPKYMAAISYCLSKFLGINPAVLDQIEDTLHKTMPAPATTGGFAAAMLGTLGFSERRLPQIKHYLRDRLTEEMERLVSASKRDKTFYKQIQLACRGRGPGAANVAHAAEIVAEANSFSTATALMRLRQGKGASEPEELEALDTCVAEKGDRFIISGVQNLQRMIWPTREETFDMVKDLTKGNELAQRGLSGWENRAECALILQNDDRATQALRGLVILEEFRIHLETKGKDMELQALAKLLVGDKNAMAVLRRLTPSLGEQVQAQWKRTPKLTKAKVIFSGLFFVGLILVRMIRASGLEGTVVGDGVFLIIDLMIWIATLIGVAIAGAWYILAGKPIRDKVVGPPPTGVELLQKLVAASTDKEELIKRTEALNQMLMGQADVDPECKAMICSQASKFIEKVPDGMVAYECLDCIAIIQQAGKDTKSMKEFAKKIDWPGKSDLWPPSTLKMKNALATTKAKLKGIFFRSAMNPWIQQYVTDGGEQKQLFENVEIPLTMVKDNAEKFDALDKLNKGYRPDPAGLVPLEDIVEQLVDLEKYGASPTNLQEAIERQSRTGNVKKVFRQLDAGESSAPV